MSTAQHLMPITNLLLIHLLSKFLKQNKEKLTRKVIERDQICRSRKKEIRIGENSRKIKERTLDLEELGKTKMKKKVVVTTLVCQILLSAGTFIYLTSKIHPDTLIWHRYP